MMKERYDNCFICGEKNPIGLKLQFTCQNDIASAKLALPSHFEGYDGIIHGGIVAALLDEAMAKAILFQELKGVTININIDYKNALPPETEFVVEGKITAIDRRVIITEAKLFSENKVYAAATGKFFVVK